MGFLISVVELVQDCFIVTVARVKGMLTDEMLAQKESAVKSKRAKRKGLRPNGLPQFVRTVQKRGPV